MATLGFLSTLSSARRWVACLFRVSGLDIRKHATSEPSLSQLPPSYRYPAASSPRPAAPFAAPSKDGCYSSGVVVHVGSRASCNVFTSSG